MIFRLDCPKIIYLCEVNLYNSTLRQVNNNEDLSRLAFSAWGDRQSDCVSEFRGLRPLLASQSKESLRIYKATHPQ